MQPVQITSGFNPAALFEKIARAASTCLWSGFFFLLNFQTADIKSHNAEVFRHSRQTT
jgi:hypothetical protein